MIRPFVWTPLDPERVAHYRAGPECSRSSCHRTALVALRPHGWLLCGPCLNAVAAADPTHEFRYYRDRVEVLEPPRPARPDELPGANQDAGGIPVGPWDR